MDGTYAGSRPVAFATVEAVTRFDLACSQASLPCGIPAGEASKYGYTWESLLCRSLPTKVSVCDAMIAFAFAS